MEKVRKWIRDRILGADKSPRAGIIHDEPTAAFAEQNAVAHALRLLGAPDPAGAAPRYTRHVAAMVAEKPDHPAVKHYVEKAKVLGGTAGPELAHAVKPLVGAVNLLLHVHGLDSRFVSPRNPAPAPPVTERPRLPSGFVQVPPEEPFTLAPAPKLPDRHQAIMSQIGQPLETIVEHLMGPPYNLNRANALASIRRAKARAKILHERAKNGPKKLARPGENEALRAKHLTGEAWTDNWLGAKRPVDPQIANTALAYHLRQIAQTSKNEHTRALAEHALSGTSMPGIADPFRKLGQRLKAEGHGLADAYNWHSVDSGLALDKWVNQAVQKHVLRREGMTDHEYWDQVHRQYGSKDNPEFWARLVKEAGSPGASTYLFGKHGPEQVKERVRASINRIADRHLDREYLGAVRKDKQQADPIFGLASVLSPKPRGANKFARAPQSVILGPAQPSIHPATGEQAFIHHYHDENGNKLGSVKVVPKDNGETLHIPWIGQAPGQGGANALGAAHTRSLLRQAKAMYPAAKKLIGLRVSGFREDQPIQDQAVSRRLV